MSRFHERKCYTRWNNSTLRKSHSFSWMATSEEEVHCLREPQLSTSLLPIAQHYVPLKETSLEYCLCGRQCNRKKSSSSSYESHDIKAIF